MRAHAGRRQVLRVGVAGAALALFGAAGAGLLSYLQSGSQRGIGTLDEIVQRFRATNGAPIRDPDGHFFLLRAPEGLLAVSPRCTHLGCRTEWNADADLLHCACHAGYFDKTTGGVVDGPLPRPLDLLPLSIRDGVVHVEIGRAIERAAYRPEQATPLPH